MSISKAQLWRLKKAGKVSKDATPEEAEAARTKVRAGGDEYSRARTRKVLAEAKLAEMEEAERRGKLVESDRVIAAVQQNAARARSILDGTVSELCSKLGGEPADRQEAAWRHALEERVYPLLSKVD